MAITWRSTRYICRTSNLWSWLFLMHEVLTRFGHLRMSIILCLLRIAPIVYASLLICSCYWSFPLTARGMRTCRTDWHIIWVIDLLSDTFLGSFHTCARILRHCLLMCWWCFTWSASTIWLSWLEAIVYNECRLINIQMCGVRWIVKIVIMILWILAILFIRLCYCSFRGRWLLWSVQSFRWILQCLLNLVFLVDKIL